MSPIFSCTWTLSFKQLLLLVHFWASLVVVFWFFDGIKLPYLCIGNLSFQQFLRYILQHISQWTLVRREFCLWDVSSLCFLGSKIPQMIQGTQWYCKKPHIFQFNKQMLDYLSILFNIVHDKQLSNWWLGYMIFQPSLLTRNPQVNMWNCNNEVHLGTCIHVFCKSLLDGTPMNIVCKHGSMRHTQICAKTVKVTIISWPRFSLSLLVCVEICALNFSRAMVSHARGIYHTYGFIDNRLMGFSFFLPLYYCLHKWITSGTVVRVALHIGQLLVCLHIFTAQSKQMVAWLQGLKQALFLPFVLPLPESSSSKQTLQSCTVPGVVERWSNTSGLVERWSNAPSKCLKSAASCSCLALWLCSCCHKSNVNHNRYTTSSPHGLSDISKAKVTHVWKFH